jgi:NADP-dependent 3-hydroxy acid dehydrogenase YdfG
VTEARARTAIITGASSGIGAATALELGARGYCLALGARRVARVEEVAKLVERAGGHAIAHSLDVTDLRSVDVFCAAAESSLGHIDVLINNAGENRAGLIHEAPVEHLRSDVEINLLGAIWMTRRVLPGMLARRAGDVVFIGSDSAKHPRPYQSAYAAAKLGLEAFARVLEMETEGTGVRSILVRVGPTGSEFGNQMPKDQLVKILESWKYWGVFRRMHWMPGASVARAIARVLEIPVEESYPTILEVQPGGRARGGDS